MIEYCPKCHCKIEEWKKGREEKILLKRMKKIEQERIKAIKKLDKKNREV